MTLIMFFEFLIGLTDVYIAGRISKEVQATYGFVIQLYFIFIVIANALTVGTVSVVSRLFTSCQNRELTEAVFSSLLTAIGAGALLAGGLNGAGDTRSVLTRVALSVWFIRIPLSYVLVLVFGFGAVSVWWSMNLSQLIQTLLISKRYFTRGWFSHLT